MTARTCALWLLVVGGLAWAAEPVPEAPMPPDAKAHYDEAVRAYVSKEYGTAIAEFRSAYELAPRREILFGWAQASRVGGDCPSAVVLYRKFLALGPPEKEAQAAEAGQRRCEGVLASRPQELQEERPKPPALEEPPPPVVAAPAPAPAPAPPVAAPGPPPRPRRDLAGGLLVGSGAVLLATGLGTIIASAVLESRAGHAGSYGAYASDIDSARATRIAGIVGLAAGGVLAVAGVIRYGVRWRRAHAPLRASIGAGGLSLSGAF